MKIVNIVSTVTLSSPLDLTLLHQRLPKTEVPGKAPWLKMRLPPDNTYIAFYRSGKFLITTKDPEKLPFIAKQVLDLLIGIGLDVKIVEIKIHNVVVRDTISLNTSLEALIVNLDPRKAEFEPEQFPGTSLQRLGSKFSVVFNREGDCNRIEGC